MTADELEPLAPSGNDSRGDIEISSDNDESDGSAVAFPAQAKWRLKNRRAVWAQRALRAAVKMGIVKPQPCAVCGAELAEAHHPDYTRPAEVQWLCRLHHRQLHAAERREEAA